MVNEKEIEQLRNSIKHFDYTITLYKKRKRKANEELLRLLSQELTPVAKEVSGGNTRTLCICPRPDLHGCHCGARLST